MLSGWQYGPNRDDPAQNELYRLHSRIPLTSSSFYSMCRHEKFKKLSTAGRSIGWSWILAIFWHSVLTLSALSMCMEVSEEKWISNVEGIQFVEATQHQAKTLKGSPRYPLLALREKLPISLSTQGKMWEIPLIDFSSDATLKLWVWESEHRTEKIINWFRKSSSGWWEIWAVKRLPNVVEYFFFQFKKMRNFKFDFFNSQRHDDGVPMMRRDDFGAINKLKFFLRIEFLAELLKNCTRKTFKKGSHFYS